MYCVECGYQNPESANFCAKCGTLLVPDEPAAQTTMSFEPVSSDVAGPTLVIRSGGGRAGEHLQLADGETEIGRAPESTVFLDDVTVSRRHAVIRRTPAALTIEDRGSLNGTYLNHHRIDGERSLADGDEVQIGKFKLTFLER